MARKQPVGFPQLTVVGRSEVKLSQGPSLGEKPWAARNIKQNKTKQNPHKGQYIAVNIPNFPPHESSAKCRAPEC